jgi:hypothetical protein
MMGSDGAALLQQLWIWSSISTVNKPMLMSILFSWQSIARFSVIDLIWCCLFLVSDSTLPLMIHLMASAITLALLIIPPTNSPMGSWALMCLLFFFA